MSELMESSKKFKTLLRQKYGVQAESSEVEAEDWVSGQDTRGLEVEKEV